MSEKGMVYLVGAGPGDYKLMTLKGMECIKKADVLVYDRLANIRYLDFAKDTAEKIYVGKKNRFHAVPQNEINQIIIDKAKEGKTVVRLKGGDPFVFGRGGEEAQELLEEGLTYEVVPGITSAISVPAYAGIPVTHRDYVSSLHIITGHENPEKEDSSLDYEVLAKIKGTLVFLMGLSNLGDITSNLVKNGMPSEKTVAVISQGTRSGQRKVIGTLADIEKRVAEANLVSPAIIVVSQVVELQETLDWFLKKPLSGKRGLVTRTRKQNSALAERLELLGSEVYTLPTIAIEPNQDEKMIKEMFEKIGEKQWIIFSSVNGVEVFWEKMHSLAVDVRSLAGIKIAAVGEVTGKKLKDFGLYPEILPDYCTAEGLLEKLKKFIKPGDKVLLPTADLARPVLAEGLKSLGAEVSRIPLYFTVQGVGEKEKLLAWLEEGELDYITFTSSSTVSNFVKVLGADNLELLAKVDIACIGPITAQTAKELNLNVAILADQYCVDGLIDKIQDYYR